MISSITKLRLFSRKETATSFWAILKWWELRRIPYNLIVGATGIMGALAMIGSGFIAESSGAEIEFPDPPLFVFAFIFFYGLMANVFYSAGWITEVIARWIWKERVEAYGEVAFIYGTLFSVLLTALPPILYTLIFCMAWFSNHIQN